MARTFFFRLPFLFAVCMWPLSAIAQYVLPVNQKPVNFFLRKGEEKRFVFSAEKGKIYAIHAEQKGIDLTVTLKRQDGKKIHYQDSPNGLFGPEIFEFKADSAGQYWVDVAPLADTSNTVKGKFAIAVKEMMDVGPDTLITNILAPELMKKDLDVFYQIRKKANSGFYRYRSMAEMDSLYAWAYAQINQPLLIQEFYKIILTLTDFEGSCHNNTYLPHGISSYLKKGKGYFPFYLRWVNGGMLVNNAGKELPLGTRIVSINGMRDADIMHALFKYSTTDGYNLTQKQSFSVNYGFGWRFPFEFGFSDQYTVGYVLPGTVDTLSATLHSISEEEKQANSKQLHSAKVDSIITTEQDLYSFRMLDANTGLLNIRTFTMASNDQDPEYAVYCHFLDSVFRQLRNSRIPNLVIDIRNNPGGNNPNDLKLFTYLAKRPFRENKEAFIAFKKVPLPQYFIWDSNDPQNRKRERKYQEKEWQKEFSVHRDGKYIQNQDLNPYWQPDSIRFVGNLYVLIDENVGSAASHFAAHIRDNSDATLVGVETVGGYYGHNGHIPVEYELPGSKIRTRFSIVCVSQDVSEHPKQSWGHGVMPDYEVRTSYDDFIHQRDTQMDFVLRLIQQKK